MDPGNWATDIAGGSEFGYKLIWVLLMSNLMALLLQSLSVRLGVVGGMDLAQASKNAYPKWANIPLYILAEIAIAACDLAEIVGMAFVIKPWIKILSWATAAIIIYLNIKLVSDEISNWIESSGKQQILIYTLVVPIALACLFLLSYIFVHPFISVAAKKRTQLPHGEATDFKELNSVNYSHIGIAIDFSGRDQQIIKSALNQGGKDATYTLIHVVESAAAHYLGDNSLDYETQLDHTGLIKYQNQLKNSGYVVNIKISFGNASAEIIKNVQELQIDLLVMGAHGHRGIKDLIFGTTVDAVRHRVKIPLLLVN